GACVDLEQSTENCGACGQDCNMQTQNAEGLTCNQGACDYASCQEGFLDCDANRENGCETAMDADHCGSCDEICPNLPNVSARVCQREGDTWLCTYEQCQAEWLDCDLEQPGCETARGPLNCGFCQDDCGIGENDPACVQDPESGDYRCGCVDDNHCDPGYNCCDARCTFWHDLEHCGVCYYNCLDQLQHVENMCCMYNQDLREFYCGYNDCSDGWQDCDPEVGGCETARDENSCADCGDDCAHSSFGNICMLDTQTGAWHCGCEDERNCEANQQCCDNFCFDISDSRHCGACGVDCTQDERGPVCLSPSMYKCGCYRDTNCGEFQICCDEQCVDEDENNCGTCGNVCSPANSGPFCEPAINRCYCRDDSDCDLSAMSAGECDQSSHSMYLHYCKCPGTEACAGGQNDQCCDLGDGTSGCVDLETDENNCGGCGIVCDISNPICYRGSCHCEGGTPEACGTQRTADHCSTSTTRCACANFSSGIQPRACTLGRYCCDGTAGGIGGPLEGADLGCCWAPCGDNDARECDTEE
ncbi:MAG: hypothetical protein KAI66_17955, partial [Lentisphaeria bacterium]|nr:hypothetical protein [Lentisphaeria bacterium]